MPDPIGFRLADPPREPPEIIPARPEERPEHPGEEWPDDPSDPDYPDEPLDPEDFPEEGPIEIPDDPGW